MIKHYIKIAWRNLLRAKSYSVINIAGLSIGMTGAALIFLWIQHEVSYDLFHTHRDRIYEAYHQSNYQGNVQSWNSTSEPMRDALVVEYPEVAESSRYDYGSSFTFLVDDRKLKQNVAFVDPSFFDIFSFPFLEGDKDDAFRDPHSIVITESTARKLFGDEEALYKQIQLDNQRQVTVKGIIKDLPSNTRFNLDAVLSYTFKEQLGYVDTSPHAWTNSYVNTFVLLQPNTKVSAFNSKIKNLSKRNDATSSLNVFVYPLEKWHLYNRFENGKPAGGLIDRIYMFGIIAVFILLIACINFINLSTARSEKRAIEVGVRKVAGANRRTLGVQFLLESILLALLSGILTLLIIALVLPFYETLIGEPLYIPYQDGKIWMVFVLFILFTGVLAGSYPSFFLSSFQPASVLKGTHIAAKAVFSPRKVLVVLQFIFAITLISSTLIVRQQIRHAVKRDKGFDKDQLLTVYLSDIAREKSQLIRQELLAKGVASSITKTGAPMSRTWSNSTAITWEGKDPGTDLRLHRFAVDKDWTKTTGIPIVEGRDIDVSRYPTDSTAMLLNETAVKAINLVDPVGKTVEDNFITWTIVGVVKDFVINSPYEAVDPMIIAGPKAYTGIMTLRMNGQQDMADNIAQIQTTFNKFNPEDPLDYEFVDEAYAAKFKSEQRTASLTGLFSTLAILISCLGLFGLAAHTAQQRTKEIGIRKVLGASVTSVVVLLSKDFIRLVLIAIIIATPIAWYAMNRWLQGFAYRIDIQWWMFAGAGLMAVVVAIFTVATQTVRAAVADPVEALRSE